MIILMYLFTIIYFLSIIISLLYKLNNKHRIENIIFTKKISGNKIYIFRLLLIALIVFASHNNYLCHLIINNPIFLLTIFVATLDIFYLSFRLIFKIMINGILIDLNNFN